MVPSKEGQITFPSLQIAAEIKSCLKKFNTAFRYYLLSLIYRQAIL
jgi:hypothetical protein